DVVVTQDEHPDPPMLQLERLSASVHWRALLSGKLVGDVELIRPSVYLNLPQARKEINDPTPVKERGWQDALQAVYPLQINHFEIRDGEATYIDRGPFKPLRVRDLQLVATDIRNRRSDRPYPSDVRFSAIVCSPPGRPTSSLSRTRPSVATSTCRTSCSITSSRSRTATTCPSTAASCRPAVTSNTPPTPRRSP